MDVLNPFSIVVVATALRWWVTSRVILLLLAISKHASHMSMIPKHPGNMWTFDVQLETRENGEDKEFHPRMKLEVSIN